MAPIGSASKVWFKYLDHSGEKTRTMLHFAPVDDTGDNSGLLDPIGGSISELGTAMGLMSKLSKDGTDVTIPIDTTTASIPAAADAQREWAIRFSYVDTVTGKKYRFDVPAPVDAIVPSGTDEVDLAATLVAAFKVIFDAQVLSEFGNPCTLLSGRIVGRRN